MIHAHSSPHGILFVDSDFEAPNAVYARRTNGEIELITGGSEQIDERFRAELREAKSEAHHKGIDRAIVVAAVFVVAFPLLTWFIGHRVAWTAGAALFALVAAIPLIALWTTTTNPYPDEATFAQFKRHHGAEHAIISNAREDHPDWSLDHLRTLPIIDGECGSLYMSALAIWAAVLGIAVANIAALGLLKALGIALGAAVALLLNNWFNPHNPLRAIQRRMVDRPTDAELELASAGRQELARITQGRTPKSRQTDSAAKAGEPSS